MKNYYTYFKDTKNTDLYTVKITTQEQSGSKDLTPSGSPFTTTMDESDEILYKPVKYQAATLEVLNETYLPSIYSGDAQGTKIELYKNSDLEWTGYVEPNLYDQDYYKPKDIVQIECIDALSTLQYIPYRQTDKQIRSFQYIVDKVLSQCNAYTYYYVSNNTRISKTASTAIFNDLYISECNFFDEKGKNEEDDDVAWKCNEVLEEICKYLGLTAIADKDSIYFLDYDAIKVGNNVYWKYTIGKETPTSVSIEIPFKTIKDSDYSSNDTKLSLDEVYNKITITDSLYTYDSTFPSIFNEDDLINITSSTDSSLYTDLSDLDYFREYGEIIQSEDGNLEVFMGTAWDPQHKKPTNFNAVSCQYFNNPNYKLYKYDSSGNTKTVDTLNFTDTKSLIGCTIAKYFVKEMTDFSPTKFTAGTDEHLYHISNDIDRYFAMNGISYLDTTPYVAMFNPETGHIDNSDIYDYPFLETNYSTTASALFGGNNSYLILTGTFCYHYMDNYPYPIPEGEVDISEGRYQISSPQEFCLKAKLEWGGYYWTDDKKWSTTEQTFSIDGLNVYWWSATEDDLRADALMFTDHSFRNTVSFRIGTSDQGMCIPLCNDLYDVGLPDGAILSGTPKLTIYKPYDHNYADGKGYYYKVDRLFIKDLELKTVVGDPTYSNAQETDTEYTLIIDENHVAELDAIEFKINTWDNKKPNYSCVAYKEGNVFKHLDKTYNQALSNDVTGMTFTDSDGNSEVSDGTLRQEWWLCWRIYKQYHDPSVILDINLRNNNQPIRGMKMNHFSDKTFIVDSIAKDYKNYSQEIKLIEKK